MFVNNVVVNGVALKVAFVRSDENGVTFTGMTSNGENFHAYFQFIDGVQVNFGVADAVVAPAKKERKPRTLKAAPVQEADGHTHDDYLEYIALNGSKKGRKPEWVRKFMNA